jgi:molecular chaperone DnaJ
MAEDFYDVLGVDRDASEEEIEQAFRKKASQYHPDVSDEPDAEERFKEIQRAKDVLTDEEKRQAYDQLGHERFEQAEKRGGFDDGPGGAGRGAGGPGGPFGGGGGDPFGGGMGDIFEQFFGGGGGDRPQGGADLRTDLEITLEEAYAGVEKRLTVTRPAACDDCGGSGHPPGSESRRCPECDGRGQVTQVRRTPLGQVQQTATCPRCEGEGRTHSETCSACGGEGQVREEATIAVEIPPGIRDGQTVRMDGEGGAGDRGAPAGDLLIEVSVADHPEFERDGADLHRQVPISFPQAVFGADVEVETLDGPVEMDLPAGTQSGERFRLRGKGMPRLRGRGRGDLYAHVQVVTPEDLNEAQREALDAYAEAGGEEVDTEPDGLFDRLRESL